MKDIFKKTVVGILTWEAKVLLKRTKPTIVAVTGNVGKTSTKDAIYHCIKNKVHARKSEKSYNSDIGVPLSVLGLANAWQNPWLWLKNIVDGFFIAIFHRRYPKVLVLEMGVDRPGDMKKLTSWIKPDVVVLTRLPDVPVHVEHFSSPEAVTKEKLVLVDALKSDGVFVYNNDDEAVRKVAEETRQRSIGYGRYSPTDFYVTSDEVAYQNGVPTGINFKVSHNDEQEDFHIKDSLGVITTYTAAAASAVASCFEVGLKECREAVEEFTAPPGRMRIIKGLKDSTIIDDTYNSSPTATERALSALMELKGANRKIAVLGDMLELGQYSVGAHREVGEQAAETSDILITVGIRSRESAQAAMAAGMSEENIIQYDDSTKAGSEIQNLIQAGDVILIKGSQGMRMEKIVLDIMAEPNKAKDMLVRQSKIWQTK